MNISELKRDILLTFLVMLPLAHSDAFEQKIDSNKIYSLDKKVFYVLDSETHQENICKASYQKITLFDAKNLKAKKSWSAYLHRRELFQKYLLAPYAVVLENNKKASNCEFEFKIRSLNIIAPNDSGRSTSGFQPGNIIFSIEPSAGSPYVRHIFVIDSGLKEIAWHQDIESYQLQKIHQIVVRPDGLIEVTASKNGETVQILIDPNQEYEKKKTTNLETIGKYFSIKNFFRLDQITDKLVSIIHSEPISDLEHFVVGCEISDQNFRRLRVFFGDMCIFLEDGSYISGSERGVSLVLANGTVAWQRSDILPHHQINLSNDGKSVLILNYERVPDFICGITKSVSFVVLNLKSGATEREYSVWKRKEYFYKELNFHLGRSQIQPPSNVECFYGHMNSFYEVPSNSNQNKFEYLKPGNYIVNGSGGHILFFDHLMTKIVYKMKTSDLFEGDLHDVQVTGEGKILVYSNLGPVGGAQKTTISLVDPESKSVETLFPKPDKNLILNKLQTRPFLGLRQGGVQLLDKEVLFSINPGDGGSWVFLMSNQGALNLVKKYSSNGATENFSIQQIKHLNLSAFLRKNML